jgi:hypothetical protein
MAPWWREYPFVRRIWCSDHWRPPETLKLRLMSVAMTLDGALISGPHNATTTILPWKALVYTLPMDELHITIMIEVNTYPSQD